MRASIGIDIGTSAVKVIALSDDGRSVLGEASEPYPTLTPRPGWVEQAPAAWWRATCAALGRLLGALPGLAVIGVGLSGQVNGLVLLDADDEPLGDAPIWLDTRATAAAARIAERLGWPAGELGAIAVLSKLGWLAEHEPARLARARTLLFVKDYILFRLTAVKCTEASEATSASMLELATGGWHPGIAAAAGFDPALLPPLVPAMAVAGEITATAAAETGLPAGTPVVPGAGDVAALAVGCGVIAPGICGITLGTAGHVVLSQPAEAPFPSGQNLWRVAHADPALAVWLGLVMSGGLSLSWLHRTAQGFNPALSFEAMVALADATPVGANGVRFVPFLEGAATPFGDPLARGAFTGLSSSTAAGDMVRAVMEGVAFNVRQCVELFVANGAAVDEIRVAEGGARVDAWCRILADVLDRPILRLDALNTSSLGAALMALVGVGGAPLDALCAGLAAGGTRFAPDPARAAAANAAFADFSLSATTEIERSARSQR